MKLIYFSVGLLLALCIVIVLPVKPTAKTASVMLQSDAGTCSGVIIAHPHVLLTASHCRGLLKDGFVKTITEDGKVHFQELIKEDPVSDLLILTAPDTPGIEIAEALRPGDKLTSWTHGSGLKLYSTEGEYIEDKRVEVPLFEIKSSEDEEACKSQFKFEQVEFSALFYPFTMCALVSWVSETTIPVVPGSSGGAVINQHGDLAGIVSSTDGHHSQLVRLIDIKAALKGMTD